MKLRTFQLGALVLVAGAALLHAQVINVALNVKLGLWELTSTSETSGMPPIDTSKMTPEVRARIEAALKARGGTPSAPIVRRDCLTKEKLANYAFQDPQANDSSCKRTIVTNTSTLMEMHIECASARKMTGDFRVEVLAPDTVKMTTKMAGGEGAQVMNINGTMNGRWVSASCGDVK
jgi:Protein of unknown function (DUF3617)